MGENMFRRTRRRLTLYYSLVMAFFLVAMVYGVYKSMEWAISSEQAREIRDTANNVAYAQSFLIQHQEIMFDDDEKYKDGQDRMFFYVFDTEGRLLNFSRAPFTTEPFVLDAIQNWSVPLSDVAIFTKKNKIDFQYKLMMTAQPILLDGEKIGMVYVGKDVTAIYNGLRKSIFILGGFSLLALCIAALAGHIMSGKAIVPLKDAYEKQRQFAADASHELRTPLSVVMASADLLENDPSITSPFLKQVIGDVRDEVKKMTKLVSDLLTVARSDNQKLTLTREKFDVSEMLLQTIRRMQPLAAKKEITLSGDIAEAVEIRADEQKIKQLLLILVDNAVKYTPEGGQIQVSLEGKTDKGRVRIHVKDSGIGIAEEDQPHVFDRFFRVDKARSRELGGNGLGLAIAREIVNLHKGKISVSSKPGEGSIFTVELRK